MKNTVNILCSIFSATVISSQAIANSSVPGEFAYTGSPDEAEAAYINNIKYITFPASKNTTLTHRAMLRLMDDTGRGDTTKMYDPNTTRAMLFDNGVVVRSELYVAGFDKTNAIERGGILKKTGQVAGIYDVEPTNPDFLWSYAADDDVRKNQMGTLLARKVVYDEFSKSLVPYNVVAHPIIENRVWRLASSNQNDRYVSNDCANEPFASYAAGHKLLFDFEIAGGNAHIVNLPYVDVTKSELGQCEETFGLMNQDASYCTLELNSPKYDI